MQFTKKIISAVALLTVFGQIAEAADLVPRDRREAAAAYCSAEWASYTKHASNDTLDTWAGYPPLGIDPSLDTPTTDAFNKYALSAVVLSELFTNYLSLDTAELQNAEQFARFKSQFELATCMVPTETEKDLIVAFAKSARGISEDKMRAEFFEIFNQFSCTGIEEGSKQIVQLSPQSDSFSRDATAILSSTLKVCE